MAGSTLKLEIVTPEKIALSEETTSIVVPGVDGTLGIWPNHAPLLAGLKPGVVKYKTAQGMKVLAVAGGFVEVENNIVSIITPAAEKASEIDVERAQRSKERAKQRLEKKENVDIVRAQASLARAMARIEAAGKEVSR